jgi:hypothetical protein
MRLPRFRVKLLMLAVLVALAGVGFGINRTAWRVQETRKMVAYHTAAEADSRERLAFCAKMLRSSEELVATTRGFAKSIGNPMIKARIESTLAMDEEDVRDYRQQADVSRQQIDYRIRMRQKYERACRFPWPSVPPDPPEPEPE